MEKCNEVLKDNYFDINEDISFSSLSSSNNIEIIILLLSHG